MRTRKIHPLAWAFVTAVWLLSMLALTVLAPAQDRTYGDQCKGVALIHAGRPQIGTNTFQTQLWSGLRPAPAVFLIGVKLMAPLPVWECRLYVDPTAIICGRTGTLGEWIVTWTIPNDVALVGLRVEEQFAVADWRDSDNWLTSNAGWWTAHR